MSGYTYQGLWDKIKALEAELDQAKGKQLEILDDARRIMLLTLSDLEIGDLSQAECNLYDFMEHWEQRRRLNKWG